MRSLPANILDTIKRNFFVFSVAALIGGLSGTLLGIVAFFISQLMGIYLFAIVGGIVGLAATVMYALLRDKVAVQELQVGFPAQANATFSVGRKDREIAWLLFVETTARIATQRLEAHQGILREALESLHTIFIETRQLLKTLSPSLSSRGKTVEELALTMLNKELRPFLSKWHPRLREFEQNEGALENDWEHNEAFRTELEDLRLRMIHYARAFGELSGVQDVDHLISSNDES